MALLCFTGQNQIAPASAVVKLAGRCAGASPHRGRKRRAFSLPDLARRLQLAIPGGKDFGFAPSQFVGGGNVADRAVQAARVVVLDKFADDPPGLLQRQRATRTKALPLGALLPSFVLPVAFRVTGAVPHSGQSVDPEDL